MKTVLHWTQLLPDCGQPWATAMCRAFLGVIQKAGWKCHEDGQNCNTETLPRTKCCAEWTSCRNAALSSHVCPCWFPTEHRVAVEGVAAQRPRGGSHGRRCSVPLGQPRAAPLCPQHPRALTCCCKCVTTTLLYSCLKWYPTKSCNPDRHWTQHSPQWMYVTKKNHLCCLKKVGSVTKWNSVEFVSFKESYFWQIVRKC